MNGLEQPTPATTPAGHRRRSLGPRPLHLGTPNGALASPLSPNRPLTAPIQSLSTPLSPAASPSPSPSPSPRPRPPSLRRQSSLAYSKNGEFPWSPRSPAASPSAGAEAGALAGAVTPVSRRASVQIGARDVAVLNGRLNGGGRGEYETRRRSEGPPSAASPSAPETATAGEGDDARGPFTLVEKHADLLHFIAQKESKCLELRTQLAQHETELAALKAKWARIVSRGGLYPAGISASPSPSPSSPPPPSAGYGGGLGLNLNAASGSALASSALQHGKRMSVHAAQRLVAATGMGLADFGLALPLPVASGFGQGQGHGQGHHALNGGAHPSPPPSTTGAGNGVARKGVVGAAMGRQHAPHPSVSSSTTSTSATSGSGSGSGRLSQSSASSLGFLDSPIEIPKEEGEEAGDVYPEEQNLDEAPSVRRRSREGNAPPSPSSRPSSPSRTVSPALSATPTTTTTPTVSVSVSLKPPPRTSSTLSPSAPASGRTSPSSASSSKRGALRPKARPKSSSGTGAVAASSWVGSMGKRWDDLQKSDAIVKNSKRASLLISDVFAVLTAPSPPVSPNPNPNPTPGLTAHGSAPAPALGRSGTTTWLLDEEDEQASSAQLGPALAPSGSGSGSGTGSNVKSPGLSLSPSPSPSLSPSVGATPLYAAPTSATSGTEGLEDDEDWNW